MAGTEASGDLSASVLSTVTSERHGTLNAEWALARPGPGRPVVTAPATDGLRRDGITSENAARDLPGAVGGDRCGTRPG